MKKSPFPGMDPYLELFWRDVHHRLITYANDAIQLNLPDELLARADERVFVESNDDRRTIYPDVEIIETSSLGSRSSSVAVLDVTEPLIVEQPLVEPASQGFIEIIDTQSGNRVVTVIEFVSPSNKRPGDGRELYLQKQREVMASDASYVEIDLTRSSPRARLLPPEQIPARHRKTYQIAVNRPWQRRKFEVYTVSLRERLPKIAIPLRQTDQDIALDIQTLVEQCYINGRYDKLNYSADLPTPLEGDDAAWADALLRSAALRTS